MRGDKTKVNCLLKTARGQIDGILKMIEEDRYCIDISNQIQAANAILRKADKEVIRGHMTGCMKDALETGNEEEKIQEFVDMLEKIMK